MDCVVSFQYAYKYITASKNFVKFPRQNAMSIIAKWLLVTCTSSWAEIFLDCFNLFAILTVSLILVLGSGKSGPNDQVALHYYYTSPSHLCTRYRNCKFHNSSHYQPAR